MTDGAQNVFEKYVEEDSATEPSAPGRALETDQKQIEIDINDTRYNVSKPKRIIIRGELLNESSK